ncbi:hypothetical protein [Oscillibacter sp.]|uniref:hypothetical protein n=1 Tax=Oscillibacter sp. TaxID=1945593 RepID=UPI001B47DAC7|nr:hypothetical protein [Oscillibacter sp.]MBP3509204.1 hypothetical protein [Oscillibacter sp.]
MTPSWDKIKAEYITTQAGYRKLAEKWGVSWRTLAERSKREGWREERKKYEARVVKTTVKKVADTVAREQADKLLQLKAAADSMGEAIAAIFDDANQFHRHIITRGLGKGETAVECKEMEKVDTRAIKDLTGALKDLSYVMRNLYDLPTVKERAAMEAAAQRLELEKSKAGAAEEGQRETGVVELAAVGEDADA